MMEVRLISHGGGIVDPDIASPLRVFLSHTSELDTYPERRSFVEAAIDAVNQSGAAPGDMRWLGSRDRPPAEVCAERIRSCDVYVGVLGHRYGTVVPATDLSHTEWEFEVAGDIGIPRFIFLLDEEAAVPKRLFDEGTGHFQAAFRARASERRVVTRFRTAEELKGQVVQALMHERERRLRAEGYPGDGPDAGLVGAAGVISGEIFTGRYARLREVWLDPAPVLDEVEVSRFVGREWVTRSLDRFLRRHDRGYFVIQAAAGLGKTMFAAWLAQSRGWPCHFTRRRKGRVAATALRNLAAQLIARYRLEKLLVPGGQLPESAGEPGWFDQVVRAAALAAGAAGEQLVLVVDGLDEAEQIDGDLPLGLPAVLPKGVYIVVTCRTNTALPALRRPRDGLTIRAEERGNIEDIARYLMAATSESRLAGMLDTAGVSAAAFSDQVRQRCGGVWVYLRYVLDELRLGLRTVEDIDRLPADLAMYYAESLTPRMLDHSTSQWTQVRLPLLATLAAVAEPLPVDILARFAGLPNVDLVQALCADPLRPFLSETTDDEGNIQYGIYHISLRDFLGGAGAADTIVVGAGRPEQLRRASVEAHARVAEHYLSTFGGLGTSLPALAANPALARVDGDYALRYLVIHLQKAGRLDDLHALLACESTPPAGVHHNVWYLAHEAAGTVGDYLADLQRARDIVHQAVAFRHVGRGQAPPWGLELHYTLLLAAVKTLAANVPYQLVARLVEHRIWSPTRGLATIRQVGDPVHRAYGLPVLLPHLDRVERATVLAEAAQAIAEIVDPDRRGWAWREALTHLPPDEAAAYASPALDAVRGMTDDSARSWALGTLAPHLPVGDALKVLGDRASLNDDYYRVRSIAALAADVPIERLPELIAIAHAIDDEYDRGAALVELAPVLGEAMLDEVIGIAEAIADAWTRARTLGRLAGRVPDRQEALLERAARAAAAADEPLERLRALLLVLQYVPAGQRVEMVEAAQAAADALTDPEAQRLARINLATVADDQSKPLRVAEALDIAVNLSNATDRRMAIGILAEHLPEGSLGTALAAVQAITDETECGNGIEALAPYLSAGQLTVALETVATLGDVDARVDAVVAVAQHLPKSAEGALKTALTVVQAIKDETRCSRGIEALAPYLPAGQLTVVLDVATKLGDVNARGDALVAVAKHLSEEGMEKLLRRVASYDAYERRWILGRIASDIPERLLPDALGATQALTAEYGRALLLTQAIRYLPNRFSPEDVLDAVRAVTVPFDRADALAGLAAVLSQPTRAAVVTEALTVADSIPQPFWRAQALVELLPQLPETLQSRALASLRDLVLNAAELSPMLLLDLADALPAPERQEVIDAAEAAARALDQPIDRGFGLALLSVGEAGAHQHALLTEAREILTADAADGNFPARVAVRILRSLPDQLTIAGLRAAKNILQGRDSSGLPRLITEAIRLLPAGLIDEVIEVIREGVGYRESTALGSVVLQLPESVRDTLLDELLSQPGVASRRAIVTKACSTWRGPLDAGQRAILRRCLDSTSLDTTLCAIATAAPMLHQEQGPEALDHVLETIIAIQRWWPRTMAIAVDDKAD